MTPRMNGAAAGMLAAVVMALAVAASAMPDCRTTVASLKAQNGGALPTAIDAGVGGVDAANLAGVLKCVCKVQPDHPQCLRGKTAERPEKLSCGEALREYEARHSGAAALVKNEPPSPLYPPGGWIRLGEAQVEWYRSRRAVGSFTASDACAQLLDLRAHESLIRHILSVCGEAQERRQAQRSSLLPTDKRYHDWLELRGVLMNNAAQAQRAGENLERVLEMDGLSCSSED